MSYAAYVATTREHIAQGSSEAHTMWEAIVHVGNTGEDVSLVGVHSGDELWYIEADTKVDDNDPHYPVIVHRRADKLAAMREP